MKILIVDDQSTNRLVLKFLLEADGHECIEASDGLDGVEKFKEHGPDFVLMDIIMPKMDGYEATRRLKELTQDQYVPVVFLTAKQDESSLLKCLESGGDDFLTKPFNDIMLKAKIRAHGRTRELTSQIVSKNEELTFLHSALKEEYKMGEHVINHASGRNIKDCPNIRSFLQPVSSYNGDIVLSAYKPNGVLCVFIGDFTGHGLAASIGVVPLSHTFFSLCEKGISSSEIIREVNSVLKGFLPAHMFCAGALLELSVDGSKLMIWSGGLPAAYIVREGEGVVEHLNSANVPLGIASAIDFRDKLDVHNLEKGDRVCLMTDGILESESADGKMFGEQSVLEAIGHGEGDYFTRILDQYQSHTKNAQQLDDITLIEIDSKPLPTGREISDVKAAHMPWRISINLLPDDLRSIPDPASELVSLLPASVPYSDHRDLVRTVLTELFSNSLEHGLLGLDSQLKDCPNGFEEYYRLRAKRLSLLDTGHVEFCMESITRDGELQLKITVHDGGQGFDFKNLEQAGLEKSWGRGLPLVFSLCESVNFSDSGNCVEAIYSLK